MEPNPQPPEILAVQRYANLLTEEFDRELARTGAYTKTGMQLALSVAQRNAVLRFVTELPR